MKLLKKILGFRLYLWFVLLLALITLVGSFILRQSSGTSISTSQSVVNYIEEVNEQVFLNVGIEHVETKTNNTTIPWTKIGIPFSEKKALIILNYQAKLGIKSPAKIKEISEHTYKITLPKYEVIGVELDPDKPYELYDSQGELLSYSTKDVDTGEIVAKTLSNSVQEKYLAQYTKQLNESAKNYYQTLLTPLDSDIQLEFDFTE